MRIGIGFEPGKRKCPAACVPGQPVGQRTTALHLRRDARSGEVEHSHIAVEGNRRACKRSGIQHHGVSEGKVCTALWIGPDEGELYLQRRWLAFGRDAVEGEARGVERQPRWQGSAIGQRCSDDGICREHVRAKLETGRMGRAHDIAAKHALAHIEAAIQALIGQRHPGIEYATVGRVFQPDIDLDLAHPVRDGATENHARGIESEPRRQRRAIGHARVDGEVRGKPAIVDDAQHLRPLEEQHVAIRLDIVTEGFCRDDELRPVFQAGYEIVAQDGRFVARHDGDGDIGSIVAAAAIAYGVFEPGRTVEIGTWGELDHAAVVDPHLAVFGETGKAVDYQHISVLVTVVGEESGRIDNQHLVFQSAEAIVIARHRRIVVGPDEQLVGQRRLRATLVDHLILDARFAQAVGGKQEVTGIGVDGNRSVRRCVQVCSLVEADKADRVAFDIVSVGQQVRDGYAGIRA